MIEKLREVYAKLNWADKHIADLRGRIRAYLYGPPPAVTGQVVFDFDHGVVDGLTSRPVDVSIPLTVGDAANNLRSALDYLACILVREQGNDPARVKTYFPIVHPCRDASGRIPRVAVKGGVNNKALEIIKAVQPCAIAEWLDHPLLVIKNLTNADKHNHLTTGTRDLGPFTLTDPGIRPARFTVSLDKGGDDYAQLVLTHCVAPRTVERSGTFNVFIYAAGSAGVGRPLPPIECLTAASQFIREHVVAAIEQTCL